MNKQDRDFIVAKPEWMTRAGRASLILVALTLMVPGSSTAAAPQWISRADHPSLQAAINTIPAGGHGVVYIPPGTWVETQRAVVPGNKYVTFTGDGTDRSVLSWNCSNGGIQVNVDNYERSVVLRDLTLETQVPGGGKALEVLHVPTESSPFRTVHISGVSVRPNNIGNGNYWDYGLSLSNVWNAHIEGYHFYGMSDTINSRAGIYMTGTPIPKSNGVSVAPHSVNNHIIGYHAMYVKYAIEIDPAIVTEGLNVTAGKWVYVETGLQGILTGGSAGLTMMGVHIDALLSGVRAHRWHQAEFVGLTIQKNPGSSVNFIGIELYGSNFARVQSNNIARPDESCNREDQGIVVTDCVHGIFTGNGVNGMDAGIWLKSGTSWTTASLNRGLGNSSSTMVVDQGTNNLVVNNPQTP